MAQAILFVYLALNSTQRVRRAVLGVGLTSTTVILHMLEHTAEWLARSRFVVIASIFVVAGFFGITAHPMLASYCVI